MLPNHYTISFNDFVAFEKFLLRIQDSENFYTRTFFYHVLTIGKFSYYPTGKEFRSYDTFSKLLRRSTLWTLPFYQPTQTVAYNDVDGNGMFVEH